MDDLKVMEQATEIVEAANKAETPAEKIGLMTGLIIGFAAYGVYEAGKSVYKGSKGLISKIKSKKTVTVKVSELVGADSKDLNDFEDDRDEDL